MPSDSEPKPFVLVVEDDEMTQSYVTRVVSGRFSVLCAATGHEARRLLEQAPEITLVLMDLSLKGEEDGLMLTQWLRRQAAWKDTPIIATTAFAAPEDRRAALAAGCTAYLAKPFSPRDLLSEIDQVFAKAKRSGGD